jgi:hypothetical protein
MLLAVAIKVKGVVITSSPDPMPKAFKHKKRADVQLEVVTKSAHPKKRRAWTPVLGFLDQRSKKYLQRHFEENLALPGPSCVCKIPLSLPYTHPFNA